MQADYTLRLPQEILRSVFHVARRTNCVPKGIAANGGYVQDDHRGLPLREKLAWLSLTHVCARWRNLALGDPNLWTEVPTLLGDMWMYEFIARSRALPFSLDNRRGFDEIVRRVAPEYYQRMRNAVIRLESGDPLTALLSHPWPAIKALSVNFHRDLDMHTFLGGSAPTLLSLRIHDLASTSGGSSFTWRAPFLSTCSLVVLNVRIIGDMPEESLAGLFDTLERMSRLEHLGFFGRHSCLPALCAACRPSLAHAHCPNLESVELRCDWATTGVLFRRILPRPDVRISFNVGEDGSVSYASMQQLLRALCVRIREWRCDQSKQSYTEDQGWSHYAAPYTAFQLANIRSEFLVVRAASSPNFYTNGPAGNWAMGVKGVHAELSITLAYPVRQGVPVQSFRVFVAIISELLAAPSTRFLSLDPASQDNFPGILTPSAFPNVEVLRLVQPVYTHLLYLNKEYSASSGNGIATGPDGDGGGSASAWLFPALRVLDLTECLPAKVVERVGNKYALASVLKDVLHARASAFIEDHLRLRVYLTIADDDVAPRSGTTAQQRSEDSASSKHGVEKVVFNKLCSMPQVRIVEKGDKSGQQEISDVYRQDFE